MVDVKSLRQAGVFEKDVGNHWSNTWTIGDSFKASASYWLKNIDGQLFLWFDYTITEWASGEKKDMNYPVRLTTTKCNFGGIRYWFICPLVVNGRSCNRRVGALYLPPNGEYFGCRHCYDLTYKCQKEHDKSADACRKLSNAGLMQSMDSKNPGIALMAIRESLRRERLWSK